MPKPSGSTTTTKSWARGRARRVANSGPEHAQHADQRRRDAEVQQRPADRAVGADERDPLAQLGERSSPSPPRSSSGRAPAAVARLRRRRRRRQRPAEAGRDEVARGDDQDQRRARPTSVTTIGPSSAKPIANAALSVSVNTPFAASSCRRGTSSGIIAASAGAKNTVIVETTMLRTQDERRGSSPTRNSATNASAAQDVGDDEDERVGRTGRRRRRRRPRTAPPARGRSGSGG